jgi:hypothetical protein
VPPNFRRFLPFILIAFFLLIAGQTLFKKHSSGTSSNVRATQTIGALNLIATAEQAYQAANGGRFTSHIADLVPFGRHLETDLADGIGMQIDVSTDGHRYLVQVVSDVLSLNRTVAGTKVIAQDCFIVKSGSGVACPAPVH